jgi:pimeloyl-ACP methyl ester carboxylesterase
MRDLKLRDDGSSPAPPPTILLHGVYPAVYLPMILELHQQWHTLPLGYDWRKDIDESADMVAEAVRNWGQGEPIHLLVHSMGGLVARRFIARHPQVWASMRDPALDRGGRLVMLGTPNRGSFAIVLALSGEEKMVRTLSKIDLTHNLDEMLRILNTFAGSYQLLPSPLVDLGDDHLRLFDKAAWGKLPVFQSMIDKGKAFQEQLHPVIDAPRLLFVAGHDQETPVAVTVTAPGKFTYRKTQDGDGRVPHVLGLLPGVKTYYIKEKHGDLAKNETVLAAVHDLLRTGSTTAMPDRPPRLRVAARGPYSKTKEKPPTEVAALMAAAAERPRAASIRPELAAARLEALATADYLGTPGGATRARRARTRTAKPARKPSRTKPVKHGAKAKGKTARKAIKKPVKKAVRARRVGRHR